MAGADRPLRLKDLLELDCDSCSAAGFRCYPRRLCVAGAAATAPSPMRHLLEAEALRFGRSHSLRPKLSHLSRSLSRRLRGGFWRRREEEEEEAAAGSPVAAVSSCNRGCSSDSETSESSNSSERKSQSESDFSSASSENLHAGVSAAAAGAENEAMKRESKDAGSSSETDGKEQLSPVAVMDFPFDDEDGEDDEDVVEGEERDAGSACCASFSESLAQLQRRKMQLQNKIRRFGSIGELGPVDLEARLAASDSDGVGSVLVQQLQCCTDATAPPRPNGHRSVNIHEEADEYSLLELLTDTVSVGVDDVSERLLLDFFVETKRRSECIKFHAPTGRTQKLNLTTNGEAVRLAKGWLEGTGSRWGLEDALCRREAFVAEMERSRRWMRVSEEEREVSVVVAGLVIDELVDELVGDLVV